MKLQMIKIKYLILVIISDMGNKGKEVEEKNSDCVDFITTSEFN